MKRIFSGMQPTSQLHLGNYLGALKNWVDLQKEEDTQRLYCVVDLHAITMPYDHTQLSQATLEIAAAYMAAGIDPKKSILFVQSHVPEHAQLMWLLATMSQMGKLERMTQFKDKAGKNKERASLGLFAYPVLMAADILLYKATHVPVGEDQKQHLELTRDLASTFNTRYGVDYFSQPEPVISGPAPRVMSLRDGTKKMSKSADSDMTRINLIDTPEMIVKKIKKAKTDSDPLPDNLKDLEGRPEAMNLVTIYAALAGISKEQVIKEFAGQQFGKFKPALADVAVEHLAPITERMNELLDDKAQIETVLHDGAEQARKMAAQTLGEVFDIMGLSKVAMIH
ncbi:MAG: tryptophan--tRNA ligase [Alphaproteobacteria bacterium]|nr:tryptophan--tRNA ligase [Alphaproteobacteria bacterium]